ncbi:MAG: alpha/beta hydrolase [Dehalococcoidia bacterium]|nr:alpha/beta hydrolase [Dehalococcoidia bacterium]
MAGITHRQIETNGISLHIAEAGAGPLVLLLHGFPESWYSWRHQMPALAAAGYHVVAPDQRGYGGTDAPPSIEDYDILHLVDDAAGVLDAVGERSAVVVGHDWGSMVAWHCALLKPDRFHAVATMSVPYMGRGPMPPVQLMRQMFGNNFFYIIYFQEPDVAEAEFEADVRRTMRTFLYVASGDLDEPASFMNKPANSTFLQGLPEPKKPLRWLTEADLDYFVGEFERSGFRGPVNWYRNLDRNWELTPELTDAKVRQPALFIAGEKDGVMAFTSIEPMKQLVPDLRKLVMIPGAGHWTQQEAPDQVNSELLAFLKGL